MKICEDYANGKHIISNKRMSCVVWQINGKLVNDPCLRDPPHLDGISLVVVEKNIVD